MDFRTKYYRPNLANGTAGAAKTTPTPLRRSATKWAMPIESGGSGGDSLFISLEAGVFGDGSMLYMSPAFSASVKQYSISGALPGRASLLGLSVDVPADMVFMARTEKGLVPTEPGEEAGQFGCTVNVDDFSNYFTVEDNDDVVTVSGDLYAGVLDNPSAQEPSEMVTISVNFTYIPQK